MNLHNDEVNSETRIMSEQYTGYYTMFLNSFISILAAKG